MKIFGVLFSFMLVTQFFVPLAPSWGAFVPHQHWANARISPAEWNAHLQDHLQNAPLVFHKPVAHGETQIVSTLTLNGLTTMVVSFALGETPPSFVLAPQVIHHIQFPRSVGLRAIAYPPPVPPPVG